MGVFLGWMPDADTRATLDGVRRQIADALPADAPRLRWRTPQQWHVTLRYLGRDVDEAARASVRAVMPRVARDVGPAGARFSGLAHWDASGVLVATMDPSPGLSACLGRIEAEMRECGFAARPRQVVHITLARLARDAQLPDLTWIALPATPVAIDRIDLLQTVPDGYISLGSWPLGPGTASA